MSDPNRPLTDEEIASMYGFTGHTDSILDQQVIYDPWTGLRVFLPPEEKQVLHVVPVILPPIMEDD